MNKNACLFCVPLLFILLSFSAQALDLSLRYCSNTTPIEYVTEYVNVGEGGLDVSITSKISISEEILRDIESVVLIFSPLFDNRFEEFTNYSSQLSIDSHTNKSIIYNESFDNSSSKFEYNISLKNIEPGDLLFFKVNFTLNKHITKLDDSEYSFIYLSNIESESHHIFFYFPNNYELIDYPNYAAKLGYRKSKRFEISDNRQIKPPALAGGR